MGYIKNLFSRAVYLFLMVLSSPVWADLPTPPSKDLANGDNDWIDVLYTIISRGLGYVFYALAGAVMIGVVSVCAKAYHTAHDKGDLTHFFKYLVLGLFLCALAIGLIYAGAQINNQQN